jgi:hypothetical protein
MATVKHWVNNNQEDNRFDVSANLPDDRTQVSFLPAFRANVACTARAAAISHSISRRDGVVGDLLPGLQGRRRRRRRVGDVQLQPHQ